MNKKLFNQIKQEEFDKAVALMKKIQKGVDVENETKDHLWIQDTNDEEGLFCFKPKIVEHVGRDTILNWTCNHILLYLDELGIDYLYDCDPKRGDEYTYVVYWYKNYKLQKEDLERIEQELNDVKALNDNIQYI
jgi:hypothetical protein